jgi:hypothetical protein
MLLLFLPLCLDLQLFLSRLGMHINRLKNIFLSEFPERSLGIDPCSLLPIASVLIILAKTYLVD